MTATETPRSAGREQTRARDPDETGYIERDGVRVFWERYGEGEPAILFLPTWSIVHSRVWKAQIPYFARRGRVLTFDGRGNGRSDRPAEPEAYAPSEFVADALAVIDASGTDRAWVVSLSMGAPRAMLLGANHAERVEGLVFIAPAVPLPPSVAAGPRSGDVHRAQGGIRGLGEVQPPLLARALRGLPRVLLGKIFSRAAFDQADRGRRRLGPRYGPRDACATDPRPGARSRRELVELAPRIRARSLVIHGTDDAIRTHPLRSGAGQALGRTTGHARGLGA